MKSRVCQSFILHLISTVAAYYGSIAVIFVCQSSPHLSLSQVAFGFCSDPVALDARAIAAEVGTVVATWHDRKAF
jgi:hypothetical protein